MIDFWMLVSDWFMGLGRAYGVDPVIFGSIYVTTVPFFWASVAWLVRNARAGSPITLPVCSTSFFTIAAYAYPFAVGENLPVWIYLVAVGCIVCCGLSTVRTVRKAARTPRLYTDPTNVEPGPPSSPSSTGSSPAVAASPRASVKASSAASYPVGAHSVPATPSGSST